MSDTKTHTYYRIQPAGLSLNHSSEDSAGDRLGLHVFGTPQETIHCEETPTEYGDEVVVIRSVVEAIDNGDVEGWLLDAAKAEIVRRYSLNDFARAVALEVSGLTESDLNDADEDDASLDFADCPVWFFVRQPEEI